MAGIGNKNYFERSNKTKEVTYCPFCGTKLDKGARFCKNCGEAIIGTQQTYQESEYRNSYSENPSVRRTVYEGDIHKCPNCGQILRSFELSCPACGYEFRDTKASNAVKEFALKLEAIESKREYEKPHGFFAAADAQQRVSKTDEQKISLIKSFSVPNSKEDMLEFMILATSSMDMDTYDATNTNISKSEKEINAAWYSKVKQVYEKAKRSYSTDSVFAEIRALYDNCNEEIKKAKKKCVIKLILMFGWIPLAYILIFVILAISSSKGESEERRRLDNIVLDVQQALDNGEYSHALRIADSIDYQRYDVEMERKWDLEREYWIEKVLEEAAENGEDLEYAPTPDVDKANDSSTGGENNNGGFVDDLIEGFSESVQFGLENTQKSINESSRVLDEESKE